MRKIWLAFLATLSLTIFVAMPAYAASNCPLQSMWSGGRPAPAQACQAAGSQASCNTPGGAACNSATAGKIAKLNCGSLQNLGLNDLLAL
ncbi:MAG: hypothetical protein ACM3X6_01140, partial [Patescibacteria group bacterium]